jgi:hypothetical protein
MPAKVAGRGIETYEESATPLQDAPKGSGDVGSALSHPSERLDRVDAATDAAKEAPLAEPPYGVPSRSWRHSAA